MNKLTVRDVDFMGRRALVRVDFNVPIKDGKVADDTRITAALPTLRYILDHGGSVVLMSHLGRPKGGKVEPEFSLKPVAGRLQELLGKPVVFGPDCVGAETLAMAQALKPGEVMLVENTRFYKEEEGKAKLADTATDEEKKAAKTEMKARQKEFAQKLARLGDGEIYVNDAFGSAHRAHGSTAVVCRFYKKSVAGFLMEKEIDYLGRALSNPERPFVAILGGAKVSDKVNVITNLLDKVNSLIIGGAMAYTFYRAKELPTGKSLVEEDKIDLARDILVKAQAKGVKVLLPVDNVIADAFDAKAHTETVGEQGIRVGWMALDIGPQSAKLFAAEIVKAKTVVWNGPMGCFEMAPFAAGTLAVAQAIAGTKCLSIIGGGDSVSAVNKSGLADRMTHISTGGGASLEFLEGKELPGVAALSNKS
ncbi:MAG: phosphoglycerate kinase [Verrucomicrobia bacterium]|nr:phosphoglycerate kinase [Verrucomicrobiota bacterium]MCG2680020.1 phosphoglycerate kinase [Kiritimatiellia bacterium]MBU4247309.1 phosphoglycerate kinase [Verrucomicrobiota bacterium]MBU4290686.1 phosphoglycerate kinase [Verrucomicrobiota bacterium]MBU4428871.1 phosphoglycerate kinase [Verrucomicrobiota bacterium]